MTDRDVNRTDRTNTFFSGNDNPGLTLLHDVLMTYCMYNFDLGGGNVLDHVLLCLCPRCWWRSRSEFVTVVPSRLRPGDERSPVSHLVRHPERGGVLLVSDGLHGAGGESLNEELLSLKLVFFSDEEPYFRTFFW